VPGCGTPLCALFSRGVGFYYVFYILFVDLGYQRFGLMCCLSVQGILLLYSVQEGHTANEYVMKKPRIIIVGSLDENNEIFIFFSIYVSNL
jgi:hypothetical protein